MFTDNKQSLVNYPSIRVSLGISRYTLYMDNTINFRNFDVSTVRSQSALYVRFLLYFFVAFMSTLHFSSLCFSCWFFMSVLRQMLYVGFFMSVLHVSSSCQCFMSVLHACSSSCQFFMSVLHVSSSCQFFMPVLYVSSSCQFFISVLHVSSSCQFFMSVLHVSSLCQFFMSVLHVKIFVILKFLVRRRTLVLNLIAFKY